MNKEREKSILEIAIKEKDGVYAPRNFDDYEITLDKDMPAGSEIC